MSAEEVQTQREQFVSSSPVEVQKWYADQQKNVEPVGGVNTPVATASQTVTSTPTAVVSKIPEQASTDTPTLELLEDRL